MAPLLGDLLGVLWRTLVAPLSGSNLVAPLSGSDLVAPLSVSVSESQSQSSHSQNSEFAVSEVRVHRVHSLRFPGIKDRLHSSEFIVSEFTVSQSLAVTPDAWQGSPLMIGMVRNLKL